MTMTRTDDCAAINQVLADQYKAWAAGDADTFVADYTEHATVIMPGPTGGTGRKSGRAWLQVSLPTSRTRP